MVSEIDGNVSDSGVTNTESAAPVTSETASQDPAVSAPSQASTPAENPVVASAPVVAEQPPAYTPNFRYKAFQQEKEFPEWLRKAVTSKEEEEQFRSLLCKADGLDGLKPRYQQLQEAHADAAGRLETLAKYAKDDLHSFFEACGIERKRLVDWLLKADEIERDPQRKEAWQAQRTAQQREAQIQQQFEEQQARFQHLEATNHQMQLRTVMSDPDVSAFGKSFDAKLGDGAFMAHIFNVGNSHFLENGKNLSPAEACAMVIRQYHRLVADSVSATPTAPAAPMTSADGMPVVAPVKPIPTLGNGSSNTGKPKIKNLDDLRKRAEQLAATQ